MARTRRTKDKRKVRSTVKSERRVSARVEPRSEVTWWRWSKLISLAIGLSLLIWLVLPRQPKPNSQPESVAPSDSLASLSIEELESILGSPVKASESLVTQSGPLDIDAWTAKVDEALNLLQNDLPRDPQASHLTGLVHLRLKRTKQSEPFLRQAIELSPHSADMRLDLADLLSQLGRDDETLEELKAVKPQAMTPLVWKALGDCQVRLGELVDAAASFESALAVSPSADLWLKLSNVRLQQNQLAECEACTRKALSLESDNTEAWTLLGRVLSIQKRMDEASEAAARVKALTSEKTKEATTFEVAHSQSMSKVFGSAFRSLAILYQSKGQPQKAEKYYELAMNVDPEDWVALGKWAALYRTLGQFERSARLQRQLLQSQPLEVAHYQNMAHIQMEMQHPREAEAALRLACERLPDNGNCHLLLGRFLLYLGKANEAIGPAQRAYDILQTKEAFELRGQALSAR